MSVFSCTLVYWNCTSILPIEGLARGSLDTSKFQSLCDWEPSLNHTRGRTPPLKTPKAPKSTSKRQATPVPDEVEA